MNEPKVYLDGNKLISETLHNRLVFEVVDEPPLGFMVWNIGPNVIPGYLPFCRLARKQPFPGGRNIEVDTLKAMKFDGAEKILRAASSGKTVEQMEQFIEKNRTSKSGDVQHLIRIYADAIPLMKKLGIRK